MLIHIYIIHVLVGIEVEIMYNIIKIIIKRKMIIIIHYHLVIYLKKMKYFILHSIHLMVLQHYNNFLNQYIHYHLLN